MQKRNTKGNTKGKVRVLHARLGRRLASRQLTRPFRAPRPVLKSVKPPQQFREQEVMDKAVMEKARNGLPMTVGCLTAGLRYEVIGVFSSSQGLDPRQLLKIICDGHKEWEGERVMEIDPEIEVNGSNHPLAIRDIISPLHLPRRTEGIPQVLILFEKPVI